MIRLEFDTLDCVYLLMDKGLKEEISKAIVEALSKTPIRNLYSKSEVNEMVNEVIRETLEQHQRELDRRFNERRQELDQRLNERRQEFDAFRSEVRSQYRWLVGTIVTCTLSLISYLHLIH